jgi:hypothetical protein
MDYPLVFAELFPGENVSPVVNDPGVTYAQIAQTWRGSGPIPSEATLQSTWNALLVAHPEYGMAGDVLLAELQRKAGRGQLDQTEGSASARLARAIIVGTVTELNDLRAWITSFKAAVAAASSLANLQTRVAALANTPQRTKAQVITFIKNNVTANE